LALVSDWRRDAMLMMTTIPTGMAISAIAASINIIKAAKLIAGVAMNEFLCWK